MVLSVWATGDSQAERFETARGAYAALHYGRRRPGTTLSGFHKALARLPMPVLRAVATGVRQRLAASFSAHWSVDGFIPMGCDGSRVECPRSDELLARLDGAGKEGAAPTTWITAFVHLRLGLLWAWRQGGARASEQRHLLEMLALLPAAALIVTDAGYFGYALAAAMSRRSLAFLLRVSSKSEFYTLEDQALAEFSEGIVYYWPNSAREQKLPPLRVRLLRVRGGKHDVWLVTNVVDPQRLSLETAGRYYRWRWENEGLFRSYKRTLNKVKLTSRTVRLIHRELEGSLLALQLLLAQNAWAIVANWKPRADGDVLPQASVRQTLIEIRREMRRLAGPQRRRAFAERIGQARRPRRQRTSAKEKRPWPRRKPHKPPKPPRINTLPKELNPLFQMHLPPGSP